jgi:hypothetical protein
MRVINLEEDPKSKRRPKESEIDYSNRHNKSPMPKLNQNNSLNNFDEPF